jgi:hypothetical protein
VGKVYIGDGIGHGGSTGGAEGKEGGVRYRD